MAREAGSDTCARLCYYYEFHWKAGAIAERAVRELFAFDCGCTRPEVIWTSTLRKTVVGVRLMSEEGQH